MTNATITREINISGYRYVDMDFMEIMTEEDRAEAEAQLDKITLSERLQGKFIDLSQWLCEEEISDYQALNVTWAFSSELESAGISMEKVDYLIQEGNITIKECWADGYGSMWDITIND